MARTIEEARQSLEGSSIWLWHYLHADWQWEQSREWHEERYALAVEEVLDLMRTDDELTYFFDTASEFYEPVARLLGPRLDELHQRVREDRIRIVSAQVANARPNQVADETYVRNLQLGRAFFEAHLPPTDISLFHSVDIAIGHSQMPQLLRLAGFRYYRAWRPHGPMNALGIPHQFVWRGLDGSRILVTRGAYGGFYLDDHVPWEFDSDWDGAVLRFHNHMLADQLLRARSNSKQLWAIQGCDDSRPFRAWQADKQFDLPAFVKKWRENEAVPLHWCTPLEFSQAVAQHEAELPEVAGVIDGCDCSYNAANSGQNGLWGWRVENDRRLLRAERWAAIAASLGEEDRCEELTGLWGTHCVYQAHAEEFAFTGDFDRLVDLAQEVRLATQRIEQSSLQAIALAAGGGGRLTRHVFNPNPWPIETDLEVYHASAIAGIASLSFTDAEGTMLPSQVLRQFRHPRYGGSVNDQHSLVRVRLPAFGYRTIAIAESPEEIDSSPPLDDDQVLETRDLRLEFRDHALRAIVERASGRRIEDGAGATLPGLTFHELDDQNWLSAGPEIGRYRFEASHGSWIEHGPLRWRHRSVGRVGPYAADMDLLIPDRGREIDVRIRLEGHWNEAPQYGWLSLLMPVDPTCNVTVDVPFGTEPRDPDRDVYAGHVLDDQELGITSMFERLRPGWFWARSWADFSHESFGMTMTGANGNFFWQKEEDEAGPVLLRLLKRTPDTWEERCTRFMTGTGVHEFRYVIRFHDGDPGADGPHRNAAELHHPPVVVRANHPAPPRLPVDHSFIEIDGPALVSAACLERGDLMVRLFECTGSGGAARVRFDRLVHAATMIDLTGQEMDELVTVEPNAVSMTLRPWQIATIRVQLANR